MRGSNTPGASVTAFVAAWQWLYACAFLACCNLFCFAICSRTSAWVLLWELCVWKLRAIFSMSVDLLSLSTLCCSLGESSTGPPCLATFVISALAYLGSAKLTVSWSFSLALRFCRAWICWLSSTGGGLAERR